MSGGVYGASGEDYGVSGGVKRGCGVSGGGCGCQEIVVECQEGTVGCRKRLCVSGGVVGGNVGRGLGNLYWTGSASRKNLDHNTLLYKMT